MTAVLGCTCLYLVTMLVLMAAVFLLGPTSSQSRPGSGLDCLICAKLARQRTDEGGGSVPARADHGGDDVHQLLGLLPVAVLDCLICAELTVLSMPNDCLIFAELALTFLSVPNWLD